MPAAAALDVRSECDHEQRNGHHPQHQQHEADHQQEGQRRQVQAALQHRGHEQRIGGQPCALGINRVERADGRRERLGHSGQVEMMAGDVFVIEMPGGGWGVA